MFEDVQRATAAVEEKECEEKEESDRDEDIAARENGDETDGMPLQGAAHGKSQAHGGAWNGADGP